MNNNYKNITPFIVALGASTQEMEGVKSFFLSTLANENIAYVLIPHSEDTKFTAEALQRYTAMNIINLDCSHPIEGNSVYIVPPGSSIALNSGQFDPVEQSGVISKKSSLDYFLASLGKHQGSRAISIIFSGMGSNGAVGLKSFKESGGLVLVQKTNSAFYESLPKSTVDTGIVDYVLSTEDMYAFVLHYMEHLSNSLVKLQSSIPMEINHILGLLKDKTGHDFISYKPNTILRRIQKRLNILQINNLSSYIYYLQQQPTELDTLLQELLINVTSFFRDPDAFSLLTDLLKKRIIPNRAPDETIRIWVCGCATGEEAYSLAMILHECMLSLQTNLSVQIFATDLDSDAIRLARSGLFPLSIENDLSVDRLSKFFIKEENNYKINNEIRRMIVFAEQNLIKDPPFTRLDLLSCRNLLIYLNSALQKKILPLFHYSLSPHGLLFLGTSETVGYSNNLFSPIDKKWKIFERVDFNSSFKSMLQMPTTRATEQGEIKKMEKNTNDIDLNLSNLIKNLVLKNYTSACIVIDEKGNIIFSYGKANQFLSFPVGEVKLQFMDMISSDIKYKISSAVQKAAAEQKEIVYTGLSLTDDNKIINIRVRPLIEVQSIKRKLMLIVFEDVSILDHSAGALPLIKNIEPKAKNLQLQHELNYTKESLQITIEELETANEDLKSSNEELQSTNEELQSTNEELETSKEELQSLNEELTTVNIELESRIEQLSSANDDIKNLLDNTEVATIFLDKELCIKRFTPKATEIINLISTDIGRPISHIVSNLKYEKLVDDARSVLVSLEPKTTESVDNSGYWHVIRIIPYRTITNIIDGVVITFLNIHAQKKAETKLLALLSQLETLQAQRQTLMSCSGQAVLIINKDNVVMEANKLFLTQFSAEPKNLINHNILEIKQKWDKNKLKELLDKLKDNNNVKDFKMELAKDKFISINAEKSSDDTKLLLFLQL